MLAKTATAKDFASFALKMEMAVKYFEIIIVITSEIKEEITVETVAPKIL